MNALFYYPKVLVYLGIVLTIGIVCLPVTSEGVKMHDLDSDIGILQNEFRDYVFDHEIHEMLGEKCSNCHHHAKSEQTESCMGCHEMKPDMFKDSVKTLFMPCHDCHSVPNPKNPSLLSCKAAYHQQCFRCHRGIEGIGETPKGCYQLCHEKR